MYGKSIQIRDLRAREHRLDELARMLVEGGIGTQDAFPDQGLEDEEPQRLDAPAGELGGEDGLEVARFDGEELCGAVEGRAEGGAVGLELLFERCASALLADGAEDAVRDVEAEDGVALGERRGGLAAVAETGLASG